MLIRSRMCLIMGLIEPERSELFALEFGKIAEYDFVYTLSSPDINQSAPNLVKMYVIIRSYMSLIMDLIRPELSELSALEFENLPYLTVNTISSANIDQSVPNLATIYMPIRSRMSSIMGQIEPEHPELFALEFGKIAEYYSVYTLSSPNINQSAPNLVKMYVIIRSQMSSIMEQIKPENAELFAFELGKIVETDFVYTLASTNINHSVPNLVKMYVTIRFQMSSVMDF